MLEINLIMFVRDMKTVITNKFTENFRTNLNIKNFLVSAQLYLIYQIFIQKATFYKFAHKNTCFQNEKELL